VHLCLIIANHSFNASCYFISGVTALWYLLNGIFSSSADRYSMVLKFRCCTNVHIQLAQQFCCSSNWYISNSVMRYIDVIKVLCRLDTNYNWLLDCLLNNCNVVCFSQLVDYSLSKWWIEQKQNWCTQNWSILLLLLFVFKK